MDNDFELRAAQVYLLRPPPRISLGEQNETVKVVTGFGFEKSAIAWDLAKHEGCSNARHCFIITTSKLQLRAICRPDWLWPLKEEVVRR